LNNKNTYVIKSDGSRTPFDYHKVMRTCVRAGASRKTARMIANRISKQIHPEIRTSEIYKMVLKALSLGEDGQAVRHRYRLKESIMRMGPAGFLFEDYVSRILENTGYKVDSLRLKIDGRCVRHEVDISALHIGDNKRYMVECKYHNMAGIVTGIKDSLYTHARFLDLGPNFDAELLVTNTKVSQDVITYAGCIGQKVISWRFPADGSLERLIESRGLYPLTILPLSKKEIVLLYHNGIEMAKDLLLKNPQQISMNTGIPERRIRNLQDLTRQIIS